MKSKHHLPSQVDLTPRNFLKDKHKVTGHVSEIWCCYRVILMLIIINLFIIMHFFLRQLDSLQLCCFYAKSQSLKAFCTRVRYCKVYSVLKMFVTHR